MILDINELTYIQEEKVILNQINWQVKESEHWCLLGLNGSGKTSLLNIVNGYKWPSSGSIVVLGHRFGQYDLRELRKSIGWVSSSLQAKMYESDTAYQIVLSGKNSSIGLYEDITEEDHNNAIAHIKLFNLEHVQHYSYGQLSQGERQKVLIARALMNNPKLLVLDEPCTGLDFIAREDLLDFIEHMANTLSVTIIYVTHHIDEIRPFITKALLLKEGQIFDKGDIGTLLTNQTLTSFFGRPLHVAKENDRFWLTTSR